MVATKIFNVDAEQNVPGWSTFRDLSVNQRKMKKTLRKENRTRKDENKKCDPKYRSKSTLDDTRRENEENPDLLRALKYLKEYGYEESEDDEPRPSSSAGPQSRPQNRQQVEQHECGNAEDIDGKTGICFNFEKKGACLIRGYKYIHMDRNASYSNYSNDLKCKRSNTEENDHKLYRL